jgi:hypothetical protein
MTEAFEDSVAEGVSATRSAPLRAQASGTPQHQHRDPKQHHHHDPKSDDPQFGWQVHDHWGFYLAVVAAAPIDRRAGRTRRSIPFGPHNAHNDHEDSDPDEVSDYESWKHGSSRTRARSALDSWPSAPCGHAGHAFTLDGQSKVAMGFTTYALPRGL